MEERLREWATARGYGLAIAGIDVIKAVRQKLEERRSAGMIDAGFFKENLGGFDYLKGSSIQGPKCVVMVAVPCPVHVLPVTVRGRKIEALIPPTYVRYRATFAAVLSDMKKNALGRRIKAEILKAPLKSLAVHMGLVSYGRNNITYFPGLGSSYQLCGYLVGTGEMPVDERANAERRETALARCSSCRACIKICPTGAIREDRFLISAERCYTLHSESRRPMPHWAKPPKSICLIGCMACQQVCPENKDRLKTMPSGVRFTAEETEAVLEAGCQLAKEESVEGHKKRAKKSRALIRARAKLARVGLSEDLDVMGRNLGYFLKGTQYHFPDSRKAQ